MSNDETYYVNYLKEIVMSRDKEHYEMLLDRLWRKEYYSILPNDQNREKDGLLLRDILENDDSSIYGPCRVLEMLIALSQRMAREISGTGYDITERDLFWEFIKNLGLYAFDNLAVVKDAKTLKLDHILTNWIERRYSPDGSGGIFPLTTWRRTSDKNQTKVEIWYQMMRYLDENYEFN